MNDGCPELDRGLGLELIKEAEEVKRRRAQAEIHVGSCGSMWRDWTCGSKKRGRLRAENGTDEAYCWLARLFPGSPLAVGSESR